MDTRKSWSFATKIRTGQKRRQEEHRKGHNLIAALSSIKQQEQVLKVRHRRWREVDGNHLLWSVVARRHAENVAVDGHVHALLRLPDKRTRDSSIGPPHQSGWNHGAEKPEKKARWPPPPHSLSLSIYLSICPSIYSGSLIGDRGSERTGEYAEEVRRSALNTTWESVWIGRRNRGPAWLWKAVGIAGRSEEEKAKLRAIMMTYADKYVDFQFIAEVNRSMLSCEGGFEFVDLLFIIFWIFIIRKT